VVAIAGFGTLARSIAVEVQTPVDLSPVPYVTSRQCVPCHPGRYETWHRTFHRTMTQVAGPASVVGDFENRSLTYQGVTSRFTRAGDRYFIETLSPEGSMEKDEVVMTIGSRRMQQYVTKVGDRHVRLPLAWNIEERRWIHLNGAFLHPDGSDFNNHRAGWDTELHLLPQRQGAAALRRGDQHLRRAGRRARHRLRGVPRSSRRARAPQPRPVATLPALPRRT
jgi:hypothetical protein